MNPIRLNKYLADAGKGSRRSCEQMILRGRVTINGQVVSDLSRRVAEGDNVLLDGRPVEAERHVYWLVNKPKGYLCTNHDPAGRPKVIDLVEHVPQRVYTVGRLDEESEGIILLTNDGELALKLTHPRYGIEKTYRVLVAGKPDEQALARMTSGVKLSEGKARAIRVELLGSQGKASLLEMVLAEGKNREIRRMLAKLGHKVMKLRRIAIGPVRIHKLRPGKARKLVQRELEMLNKIASQQHRTTHP